MNFRELFIVLKEMKHYLIAAVLVFGAGIFIGMLYYDTFDSFIKSQLKGMQGLKNIIEGKRHTELWLFIIIFLNNAFKAIIFVYIGLFLGILPLYSLVANGIILGYVIRVQLQHESWIYVAKGLVPHGILEIPAIILASAYGLRLGVLLMKSVLGAVAPPFRKYRASEYKRLFRASVPLIVLLTGVLLIAAAIESTVTYWLVRS